MHQMLYTIKVQPMPTGWEYVQQSDDFLNRRMSPLWSKESTPSGRGLGLSLEGAGLPTPNKYGVTKVYVSNP